MLGQVARGFTIDIRITEDSVRQAILASVVTDVPFAAYWLELLARLGIVRQVPSAAKVLARLYSETDDQGVWSPAGLRVMPKSTNPVVSHYFPLEGPGKSPAQRQTDVTFRLALIARLLGMPLNIV